MRYTTTQKRRLPPQRAGYTLLELIATSGLLALTVVPSLELTRESLDLGDRIETRGLITSLCIGKLEEHLALGAVDLSETTSAGNFASINHSQIRYSVIRSQDPGDGGIANRLLAVSATVWDDLNGNAVLDSGEPSITFASKILKTWTYADEASSA